MKGRRLTPRRPRRRLAALPVGLVLLAFGGRAVTMYWFSTAGVSAYDDGRFERSATNFRRLDAFGVFEPWRADLGLGDSRYRQGDLLGAEAAFAAALDAAPGRCDIRFNLAVTIEAQGDRLNAGGTLEADSPDEVFGQLDAVERRGDPIERYAAALAVIDAGSCRSVSADDAGARLAATRERVVAKMAALNPNDDPADRDNQRVEDSADSDRADGEQIDQLEERNEGGAAQREAARDQDTTGRGAPNGQSNW